MAWKCGRLFLPYLISDFLKSICTYIEINPLCTVLCYSKHMQSEDTSGLVDTFQNALILYLYFSFLYQNCISNPRLVILFIKCATLRPYHCLCSLRAVVCLMSFVHCVHKDVFVCGEKCMKKFQRWCLQLLLMIMIHEP